MVLCPWELLACHQWLLWKVSRQIKESKLTSLCLYLQFRHFDNLHRCLAVHRSTCEHHSSNNIFVVFSGMELTTWQAPGGQCWRTSTKPTSLCTASSSGQETWCGSMLELYTGFRPLAGATTLPGMSDLSMVRSAPSSDQTQIISIQVWMYIYSYIFFYLSVHSSSLFDVYLQLTSTSWPWRGLSGMK